MNCDADEYLPPGLPSLANPQTALPAIAKDERLMALIDEAVRRVPTQHEVIVGDAREMKLANNSIHLVLTSPPYWTLKEYRHSSRVSCWRRGELRRVFARSLIRSGSNAYLAAGARYWPIGHLRGWAMCA